MDNGKKILLFNARRLKCASTSPHLGLAMLASMLTVKGHDVLVVDYQINNKCPSPDEFVKEFNPDIIGITLYTATMLEANNIINCIIDFNIPIMVGGPHASIYYDELAQDSRITFIVRGEAENVIVDVVEKCRDSQFIAKNRVINGVLPDPQELPYPSFISFFAHNNISQYPLLTSRGCPYSCNFCAVHMISSKKWRPRKPEVCISELLSAQRNFQLLDSIVVYDDSPMTNKDHAKEFLRLYVKSKLNLPVTIINTRADCLDKEMIDLLKQADCPSIAMGVEHGHPEIFDNIGKGETLEDIQKAASLIKKAHIPLNLCFVIGLPEDSLEKTKSSIKFAQKINPNHIYWNMITPFKGTRVKDWYDKYGRVTSLVNHSSWVDNDFLCDEPIAETPSFTIEERKKAYFMAMLMTVDTRLKTSSE